MTVVVTGATGQFGRRVPVLGEDGGGGLGAVRPRRGAHPPAVRGSDDTVLQVGR